MVVSNSSVQGGKVVKPPKSMSCSFICLALSQTLQGSIDASALCVLLSEDRRTLEIMLHKLHVYCNGASNLAANL